jgi:Ion channel
VLHAFIFNGALITLAVLIHYEMLYRLSVLMPRLAMLHRARVLFAVFGALCVHVFEIWLFGFGYYFMTQFLSLGTLQGVSQSGFDQSILDCVYFSFTTYTSLGFGDIHPLGYIRFLAGLEALTGILLMSWTASFLFIEMQKFWLKK